MRTRDALLTCAVAVAAMLLLATSALAGLRAPAGNETLGATLAADARVREAVADALVEALLDDAAERSPIVGGLLPLIRPLLAESTRAAIDSPAGRAALASAITDALRQLTHRGPIVVDLRAAALVAAETAPPPLDLLARTAVEQASVGVIVLHRARDGAGDGLDPDRPPDAVPGSDELSRVAGVPARLAVPLAGLLLLALVTVLVGRDTTVRPRRLLLAGVPLLLVGAATAALLRLAPARVVDRVVGGLDDPGPVADLLGLLADGLVGLLATTGLLAGALAVVGAVLSAAGARAAAGRRRRQ